jgi:hypothetical protein
MLKDGIHQKKKMGLLSQLFKFSLTDRSAQIEQRSFSDRTKEGSSLGPHEADPASGSMKATASLLQRDQLFLVARVAKEGSHRMHILCLWQLHQQVD